MSRPGAAVHLKALPCWASRLWVREGGMLIRLSARKGSASGALERCGDAEHNGHLHREGPEAAECV